MRVLVLVPGLGSAGLFGVVASQNVRQAPVVARRPVNAANWPFKYDSSKFPAAWFGANATHWESDAQIEAIGKYQLAILGWQHLTVTTNFSAVVYEQITQAAIIKERHPDLPVFVYCGFGWAMVTLPRPNAPPPPDPGRDVTVCAHPNPPSRA